MSAGALTALPEAARELIDRPEFAVLTTANPDGTHHMCVMWIARDGDALVMATKARRRQAVNLRARPRATVLLYDRERPTRYVEIRGRGSVEADGLAAVALIDRLARRYTGADGHDTTGRPDDAERVVLRVVPERVRVHG
ncbi:PPOX class F420-dependent oxidoreductase [Conexibacter sp. JD483]|uniref:PPOX class F420-dependent oxidoreductase n=1 Tax=unclassified Conexibacter TaxID=2627773 RepID=UPI0027241592|nr:MULTISPECIES: PPOX class F420-dependent oxidoreductase [unclassified Conexibacter]MDO8185314.1 PPOX class F420-dependent oxidoreductase [Conexibacter sp. CPCC 205706]MDO8198360.1 PPOX class F420-dependent oxidoreductase [Conexibacter sp. CPCC 205762]MDR9370547.1 PPOX class F420-dependent oxidoreductase [Conexibacter sp. JD483]